MIMYYMAIYTVFSRIHIDIHIFSQYNDRRKYIAYIHTVYKTLYVYMHMYILKGNLLKY